MRSLALATVLLAIPGLAVAAGGATGFAPHADNDIGNIASLPIVLSLVESGLEVSPEKAAADLAEAFRAAGIPLPGEVSEPEPAAVPPAPQLPPEMQANPWAPAPGQPQRAPMAPPPPGYGQYPYQGGYPPPGYAYGGPPPGYGYGVPGYGGYGGYGGYPPPMGGRGMGYGGGYPMHAPGMQPQGRMPYQGAPPGYGGQRYAPPPPQGARGGGASGEGAGQTN